MVKFRFILKGTIVKKYRLIYVGVNFHTPDKALKWIQSVIRDQGLVIVVDNTENKDFTLKEKIQNLNYLDVVYLDTKDNLGYLNAAQYAYQHILANSLEFEWLVVSNVDVELISSKTFEILCEYRDAAIVAPEIFSKELQIDKNPYRLRREKKINLFIKKIAFSNILFYSLYNIMALCKNKIIYKNLDGKRKCEEGETIYLPYGACFYINQLFFMQGGTINYPLFLFGEELFLAEQCRELGLAIKYVPRIKYINYEHVSTSRLKSSFVAKCDYNAITYILDRYY